METHGPAAVILKVTITVQRHRKAKANQKRKARKGKPAAPTEKARKKSRRREHRPLTAWELD